MSVIFDLILGIVTSLGGWIIGMRNVLAHQYGVVDQRKVWLAARNGVASLVPLLAAILP